MQLSQPKEHGLHYMLMLTKIFLLHIVFVANEIFEKSLYVAGRLLLDVAAQQQIKGISHQMGTSYVIAK